MKSELISLTKILDSNEACLELTSRLSRKLANLKSINSELGNIQFQTNILKNLLKESNVFSQELKYNPLELTSILQALWYSILVRYFKLFASSDGFVKLDPKDQLKNVSAELKELHKKLTTIRDKHISHGIHEDFEHFKTILALEPNPIHDGSWFINFNFSKVITYGSPVEELDLFNNLTDEVIKNVNLMINKAQQVLWEEIRLQPIKHWINEAALYKHDLEKVENSEDVLSLLPNLYNFINNSKKAKEILIKYIIENHFRLNFESVQQSRIVPQTFKDFPDRIDYYLDSKSSENNLIISFSYEPKERSFNLTMPLSREEGEKMSNFYFDLIKEPKNAIDHNDIGNHLVIVFKEYSEARNHYNMALALEPNLYHAHNNLGNLLVIHFKEFKEAKDHFSRAIEIKPNEPTAHLNFALLLKEHFNEEEKAREHYIKACDLNIKFKTNDRDTFFGL